MTNVYTYVEGLDAISSCLNKADRIGAQQLLCKLPKKPTVATWEAHQLIARAVAKFHLDKTVSADLLDLQYKFYNRCNLNDVTDAVIEEHLKVTAKGKQDAIEKARELKRLKKENDKKQEEVTKNVF